MHEASAHDRSSTCNTATPVHWRLKGTLLFTVCYKLGSFMSIGCIQMKVTGFTLVRFVFSFTWPRIGQSDVIRAPRETFKIDSSWILAYTAKSWLIHRIMCYPRDFWYVISCDRSRLSRPLAIWMDQCSPASTVTYMYCVHLVSSR